MNDMINLRQLSVCLMALVASLTAGAQSELYPRHFDLEQVELLDGPMKTAMEKNIEMLMQYDVDRLLTPFVRQAGLSTGASSSSPYYQWETRHPNFRNWGGDAGFDLSGHVGGHYVSALALAYAASHDDATRQRLKERLDYMLKVMKDCQDQYDNDKEGLYGFIGGQPINQSWRDLYKGSTATISGNWGWVPFYVQHKIPKGTVGGPTQTGQDSGRTSALLAKHPNAKTSPSEETAEPRMQDIVDEAYHMTQFSYDNANAALRACKA